MDAHSITHSSLCAATACSDDVRLHTPVQIKTHDVVDEEGNPKEVGEVGDLAEHQLLGCVICPLGEDLLVDDIPFIAAKGERFSKYERYLVRDSHLRHLCPQYWAKTGAKLSTFKVTLRKSFKQTPLRTKSAAKALMFSIDVDEPYVDLEEDASEVSFPTPLIWTEAERDAHIRRWGCKDVHVF